MVETERSVIGLTITTDRNIQAKATLLQDGYGRYGCEIALDRSTTKYG